MRILAGDGDQAADILLPEVAEIAAADRDAAPVRIEEAQEQVGDGRLPGSALPDEREPAAGAEGQAGAVQHGRPARLVGHADVFDADRGRVGRGRFRLGGIGNARRPVDELEDAPPRREGRPELAGRRRQRLDGLEGR